MRRAFEDRVILLDKPQGMTSFAAVRVVRRLTRVKKVGHCGSLDPNATGLLIVCTGAATRVTSIFMDQPKEYLARVRLGRSTDTYDADGTVVEEAPVPSLESDQVQSVLAGFVGEIEQVPPMVSALRHEGKRLYALARQGVEVERSPRTVQVYEVDLQGLGPEHIDLRIRCGRGCYVRSIASDLGRQLGVPAHLETLKRQSTGSCNLEDATSLDELQEAARALGADESVEEGRVLPQGIFSLPAALEFLPALRVRAGFESALLNGAQPDLRFFTAVPECSGTHRLLSEDSSRLLAIAVAEGRRRFAIVRLQRVFSKPIEWLERETDAA